MEQNIGQATQNALSRGVKTVSGSLHRAIDSVTGVAAPTIKQMTNSAHHTVNKMSDSAHYAADVISHKGEQLQSLQQQLLKNTRSKVRSRPLLAVGIAVAGGVLLSWWLSRRRHDEDVS